MVSPLAEVNQNTEIIQAWPYFPLRYKNYIIHLVKKVKILLKNPNNWTQSVIHGLLWLPWLQWAPIQTPHGTPESMDDKQWKITPIWLTPMGNITHKSQPHGQLATHGELYYKYRNAKQVDISLEKPTEKRIFCKTSLGRQDTNINYSI